ncbi:CPBP family glutamic-type intramembrane protease [Companilactobacillus metriopterae]|uniref:CPBP family glutamic-type intramembrane protease n=1 Tax=Companilactobacillus metriopterae TaxID=1909267 RepID=UPI00100C3423|nr:CPBP family glutamic-type intramembrane protease [Companilactobacillus metriopterae]
MREEGSFRSNIVSYIVWLLFSVAILGLKNFSATAKGLNIPVAIFTILIGAAFLYLMIKRYNHENREFADNPPKFVESLSNNFGFIILMIILVCAMRISISFLQVTGKLPMFVNDDTASPDQKVFIFSLIVNIFIVTVIQQLTQTGFFFNYFFRSNNAFAAIAGLIISGVVAGLISLPGSQLQFFMMMALGWCYALTYLYTKDFKMALLVAMVSSTIGTIII